MPREKDDAWAGALDPHPEGRAKSAFTRVHSPSKTGVNALMDALWRNPGLTAPLVPHFASLHAGYSYVQLAKLSPVPVPAGVR